MLKITPSLVEEYLSFLEQERDYIHSLNPDMAVGVTLTANLEHDPELMQSLVDASDFGSFNFYCEGGTTDGAEYGGSASYESLNSRFVNNQLVVAKGKDIVIQEMGCPSGFEDNQDTTTYPGYDGQAEYFQSMQRIIAENPSIRAAFQFQLIDSNAADDQKYYGGILLDEGLSEDVVTGILEGLGTLGVLKYDDGSEKPGWNAFFELLKSVY